jgi:hypothetical protein
MVSDNQIPCPYCKDGVENSVVHVKWDKSKELTSEERRQALKSLSSLCMVCFGEEVLPKDFEAQRELGQKLRVLREEKGYGLREVAEMVGFRPTSLSAAESGRKPFPKPIHDALYEFLSTLPKVG